MKTKFIYGLVFFLCTVHACTERVNVDIGQSGDAILVVFGEITNDVMAHEIQLTTTAPYFSNQKIPAVSNAIVQLNDGIETIELTEDPTRAGYYLTPKDYFGVAGRTYKLQISNVDADGDGTFEEYEAETVMKRTGPVDSVSVKYDFSGGVWEVALFSFDRAETKDYYLFKVYKNDTLFTDSITDYWTADDKFFNGSIINGPQVQEFDEDQNEIVVIGDTITLELAGITKGYYDFIYGVNEEAGEKIPIFSGPSANVEGNISNGALGFFSVMEVSRGYTIYDGANL